jgi:acyl dehydratase
VTGIDFRSLNRGDALPEFPIAMSAGEVRAYLDATGEQSPLWETHVPPLALGALALAGLMERVDVPTGIVHTRQELDFLRAVQIDEPLTVRITVASASERRGAVITAFESEVVDASGEAVGGGRATVMLPPEEADA